MTEEVLLQLAEMFKKANEVMTEINKTLQADVKALKKTGNPLDMHFLAKDKVLRGRLPALEFPYGKIKYPKDKINDN